MNPTSLFRHGFRIAGFIILTVMILGITTGINPSTSFAQSDPQGDIPDAVWAQMSTPQRIDSAFWRNIIDDETRILYLTYALYEPKSLPAAYLSKVGWFGTKYVVEVKDAYFNQHLSPQSPIKDELARLLQSPTAGQLCDRANESNLDTTTSTRFAFSYGGIGAGLTLNDYIQSMDTSGSTIVDTYGWAKPPLCGAHDSYGYCTQIGTNDLNNKYPVLITDLGAGLFGYVNPGISSGEAYNGFVGDNPNTALTETQSLASCMVLNSNYGPPNFDTSPPNNTAQENLDGTTSHEYVHATQNAWGDPNNPMMLMWAESTAVFMEDEVFDSGNSQYIYLYGAFGIPHESGSLNSLTDWQTGGAGPNEYANFLFFRYFAEQYGGANSATGGQKVMKKFFENVATSSPAVDRELASFKAAAESFALGGGPGTSNFKQVFHDYAIALKFMKDCQDEPGYGSAYCWEEGTDYRNYPYVVRYEFAPDGTAVPASSGVITSTTGSYSGQIKNDYGIQWVQLPADGSANYKIELSSVAGAELKASVVCDKGTSFVINPFTQLVTGATPHGWGTYNPTDCDEVVLVITDQSETGAGLLAARARPNSADSPSATLHNYTVQLSAPNRTSGPTAVRLTDLVAVDAKQQSGLMALGAGLLLLGLLALGWRKLTLHNR